MHKVICFVAREAGFRCLEVLVKQPDFKIVAVFSHRRKPSSEDPTRGTRTDFEKYKEFCDFHHLPLFIIDTYAEANNLSELENLGTFDFILSCSWRFRISLNDLGRARLAAVNLHRGKLPKYQGAEPVLRALSDGEKEIFISAHHMEEEYDTGRVIAEVSLTANRGKNEALASAVERIKNELNPLYPQIMLQAFQKIIKGKHVT